MKAVLLVGGAGTRLRPLTLTTPKPLLPIANQAFLERQLSWLASHGIDEVILSLGYLPDVFVEHFPGGSYGGIRLRYAVEDHPLGTAGGIRFASEGITERFVVCNGDVLTALDLTAMIEFHDAHGAAATIYLSRVVDPSAFGVVPTRADGEVIGFIEKPPPGAAPTDWINAGTYVLEPSVLDRIPPRLEVSIERETFPRMVETRGALYAYASDTYWLDIGTCETYLEAHADALAGRLGQTPAPGAREVSPGLWTQGDVSIDSTARVEGTCLVGMGAGVGSGCVLADAVLGPRVEIGEGARIERSVLLEGARIGGASVVTDSVVGPDARLGSHVVVTDQTIVGASADLPPHTRISGGRVRPGPTAEAYRPIEVGKG
ncbi:MAG: NDP-sugar synthase [Acidimicrobiia bacterium]|nr:NDP-sugar synthase [Acidimicrobiia bacterium]